MKDKKVIVVLGMHRSGTSALTRGLEVLGVKLGENLHPAGFDNPKGFWEDKDFLGINEEILSELGSAYDRLGLIDWTTPVTPEIKSISLKAQQLVLKKCNEHDVWGFKDPRTARLLPFWHSVFQNVGCSVGYVVATRNPLSIVHSLQQRNGFAPTKTFYLWLEHIIPAVCGTKGFRRLVVDYDRLLERPSTELLRVAQTLGLREPDSESLALYENQFLEGRLRHTSFTTHDLELYPSVPPQIIDVYRWLVKLAADNTTLDSLEVQNAFESFSRDLSMLKPALTVMARQEQQLVECYQTAAEREAQIANLKQLVNKWEAQVAAFHRIIDERDTQIAHLNQTNGELDGKIASLCHVINERDGRIESLKQAELELSKIRVTKVFRLRDTIVMDSWSMRKFAKIAYLSAAIITPKKVKQALVPIAKKIALSKLIKPTVRVTQIDSFDEQFYLLQYPDVLKSGTDPYQHYLQYGRFEGRMGCPPKLEIQQGSAGFDPSRDAVLVVSHEASRTGAPILSLNLVQGLQKKYNVVSLLLGDGPLVCDFQQSGAVVVGPIALRSNPILTSYVIQQLARLYKFRFAIVNSIESRVVLPALANQFIPSVNLIHEFAAYTRPRDAFREALLWASEAVFSTSVTHENAIEEYPDLVERPAHVFPQGRCILPSDDRGQDSQSDEDARVLNSIRPKDLPSETVVILGAGFVQLRKGVDLFLECAAKVVRACRGEQFRFVWIGKGFDPEHEMNYSPYLADQIRRAGLEQHVFFAEETSNIAAAYAAADILLISSRLDPLPNVAIDAMAHGMPVVCFDKTTGIADILTAGGFARECVASYLNTTEMAEKVLTLIRLKSLRDKLGADLRQLALSQFDMGEYVNRLEELGLAAGGRIAQERKDIEEISKSELLRLDFYVSPYSNVQSEEEAVRGYVRSWASGVSRRKLFPGFHPGIYLEQGTKPDTWIDPLVSYLRAGQPDGPWRSDVITPDQFAKTLPSGTRIALHLHVYYPDLLPEMIRRLNANSIRPDLFVSVPTASVRDDVWRVLKNYSGKVIEVQVVPNRGRDIGPMLTAFGRTIVDHYDIVGHLHTKKTADLQDHKVGQNWYVFLLENLLGSGSNNMGDIILGHMANNAQIGMVFPDDPYITGWGSNKVYAQALGQRLGIDKLPEHIQFPVGTMFWARVDSLRPLFQLGLDWRDYPPEPLPYDGSILHAIERLLPFVVANRGFRSALTNVQGITR